VQLPQSTACRCINTLTIAKYIHGSSRPIAVFLLSSTVRRQCLKLDVFESPPTYMIPTRLRSYGARPLVSCRNVPVVSHSRSSCSPSWCRSWLRSLHWQLPWCVSYACVDMCAEQFTLFRCASPASTWFSSISHWRLFAFSGSVTCTLENSSKSTTAILSWAGGLPVSTVRVCY